MMVTVSGPRVALGPMAGHPFEAFTEYTTVRKRFGFTRRRSLWGRLFRDGAGRERLEYWGTRLHARSGPLMIGIADNVAGKVYAIDGQGRVRNEASYSPMPVTSELEPPPDAEEAEIEGLTCFRMVVPGNVEEAWISLELQHSMLERGHEGDAAFTWRLFDVKLIEPDPHLFKVPPS